MGFDLEGTLRIDYSEVDELSSELEARMADVDASAKVGVDDRDAQATLTRLDRSAKELSETLSTRHEIDLDTSKAVGDMDALKGKFDSLLAVVTSPMVIGGAGLMAGGALLAGTLGASSIQAAQADKLMEKSTKMVFGTAAAEYEAQAHALADSTGFMAAELEAAQIAFNKMATSIGMENQPVKPLTQVATDLAANTGLPQYANNIQAVTRAITSGIGGATDALLEFGIRLDDAYVLSLAVNSGFRQMGDAITPAQMAQARYNALMEQTAAIHGTAGEMTDDYTASMRKWHQTMQDAKASVGEVLMPIATTVADFVANIPKPLLKAGIWAGIGIGLASTVAGAVIAIAALKRAIQELSTTAAAGAVETTTAAATQTTAAAATTTATGKVSRGLGSMATKATVAAAAISAAIPVVTAVWDATTTALEEPKQQASLQEIYGRVGQLRNLAQKTGRWTPVSAQERADLVELYGQPAKGSLSAEQVNAAIDAAEAQALRSLEARGYISEETAQYFAQALQRAIDERAFAEAMASNPAAAAAQTIAVILKDQTSGGLTMSDPESYAESPY